MTEKAFLIACGNASQYGNNAYIAPHASMQDGKIDVTVLMPFTPFDTAALALLLFTKHIDQDSNIKSFTTESLTIKREKPGAIHLDGEPIEMGTRIDVRCFKGGLHALIPSGEPKRSIIEPFASVFWEFIETVRQELNICFCTYRLSASSITSKSLNSPLSMAKRTNVRFLWNPYIPAAPGLMCRQCRVLS